MTEIYFFCVLICTLYANRLDFFFHTFINKKQQLITKLHYVLLIFVLTITVQQVFVLPYYLRTMYTYTHYIFYYFQRFTQYLASSNSSFQLSNFLDKSGVQGMCQIFIFLVITEHNCIIHMHTSITQRRTYVVIQNYGHENVTTNPTLYTISK